MAKQLTGNLSAMHVLSARALVLAAVLAIASVSPAVGGEESTEALYLRWTSQFDDQFFAQPDPQDPLFVELLKRPDADLWLLRGLHHTRDPVRRLSRLGLARLKTDRSFRALRRGTKDENMFVRERCLDALGDFRQPQCVPVLLDVLRDDPHPQPRYRAASHLAHYPEGRVEAALLTALRTDPPVAVHAALALARLQVPEAIEPTYRLVLGTEDYRSREMALAALCGHSHKQAVSLLLDYQQRKPYPDGPWSEMEIDGIEATLEQYVRQTADVFSPPPDTPEQWRAWWRQAGPVFSDDMRRPAVAERAPVRPEPLGDDPAGLTFRVALDAKTYRVGDPIAIDLVMRNRSASPLRTIPPVQSGWWPTMAYGVRLERLGEDPEVLVDHLPSEMYLGSYSGPPRFQTLRPKETFRNRQCLHDWFRWVGPSFRERWPLVEGTYRLTITFDNSEFAGVHPQDGELVHRWQAPPVEFTVAGEPRTDPDELLRLLSRKAGLRWLQDDLTSRRSERRDAAWLAVHRWGDNRLEPSLSRLPTYEEYARRWGELLPQFIQR